MSGIVLSASVRQNLLSLQSTASLLATTQNDLATGNKVNSAIDNPTDYFTAQGLNNRASDINNLLDGIGNGVQVLQAANTGITSLQSLVASAQSIANQVLQSPVGYSTKSNVTSAAITGATATNLLGTGTAATSGTVTAGAFTTLDYAATGSAATAAAPITGGAFTTLDVSSGSVAFSLNVDGATSPIVINAAAVSAFTAAGGSIGSDTNATLSSSDVAKIIDFQVSSADTTGTGPVTVSGGVLSIASPTTGTSSHLAITGYASTANAGVTGLANVALETGTAAGAPPAQTFTVAVDGGSAKTITLSAASVATYNTAKGTSLDSTNLSAANVASLINYQFDNTGATTVASVVGGALAFASSTTGTSSSVTLTAVNGTATSGSSGIVAATNSGAAAAPGGLSGKVLTIAATNSSSTATNITFGTTGSQISTLNGLNAALAANDLQATIDATTGAINIVTTNNAASSTIGAIGGTATGAGLAFSGVTAGGAAPVLDSNSQATRASLVTQYNNVLQQINTTSQDSSFNGVNLLSGDTLNLTFDETGASKLAITGVTFNDAGLGLSSLTAGSSFLDNNSANTALTELTAASSTLRTEATSLGSNLSIVQIRQDFNKNLIDVLQTGSSNLTLADTNEEAANSQALSTRQSIAVSALALANQSQQSVLQLLR
jgi:flagellin-like hook-associated protein FlgL